MALAVNVEAEARPLPLVVAVVVMVPFANVPLAPLAGAVKVTTTPLSGFPPLSLTSACKFVANAAVTVALWFDPALAVTEAGGPDKLVRL